MQISARMLIGFGLFSIAMTGVIFSVIFTYMMIGEVNRKKEGDLIHYFGFDFQKAQTIIREYQRLHPAGKLYIYLYVCLAVIAVAMFGVAKCMRII